MDKGTQILSLSYYNFLRCKVLQHGCSKARGGCLVYPPLDTMPVTYKRTSASDIGKGFDKLKARLEAIAEKKVQVGILGASSRSQDRRYVDGQLSALGPGISTNAQVGFNMEYGVSSNGGNAIPARSFLEAPLRLHMDAPLTAAPSEPKDLEDVPRHISEKALGVVLSSFDTGGFGAWQENSPNTVRAKGRNEPGIDTGQLRDSITSRIV